MKKFVLAGLVALSVMAITQQQASAWINSRFGIGLNWHTQSGGNQILWGAWRNGQPPGPEAYGYGGHHHQHSSMPTFYAPPAGGFYGSAPYQAPMQGSFTQPTSYGYYYTSPFQFANYTRPSYYHYYPETFYWYYNND